MPGAFFNVQRLINGAVEIEHKMDAQIAHVMKDLEALTARACDVEVNDELVDDLLQQWQVPTATADLIELLGGQGFATEAIAVWSFEGCNSHARSFPGGFIQWSKATFDAIGVVSTRVEPKDDGRTGMDELARDDD